MSRRAMIAFLAFGALTISQLSAVASASATFTWTTPQSDGYLPITTDHYGWSVDYFYHNATLEL